MEEYKLTMHDEMDTIELAQNIESEKFPNMVICLYGDLGSGKTVFAKAFGHAMGIDGVTSSTFNIIKEYNGEILFNDSTFERLIINKIAEKTKFIDVVKKSKPYQQKHRKTDTKLRINAGATYGPFNEIDSL